MPRCQVLDIYFYDLDIKTICRHTTWYLDIMYCIYAVRYVKAYKNIWMMHQIADSTGKTMATTFTCIERKLSDQYLCHQALLPLTAEQEHPDVSWCSLPLVPWYGGPGNTNEGHQGSNFSGVPSHSKENVLGKDHLLQRNQQDRQLFHAEVFWQWEFVTFSSEKCHIHHIQTSFCPDKTHILN